MRTCAPYALRGDISIGISGPRDLTVRRAIVRPHGHHAATRRARHIPHSTLVTIAMRPSAEARRSQSNRISKKRKWRNFFASEWTGQIDLRESVILVSARRRFRAASGLGGRASDPSLELICPTSSLAADRAGGAVDGAAHEARPATLLTCRVALPHVSTEQNVIIDPARSWARARAALLQLRRHVRE